MSESAHKRSSFVDEDAYTLFESPNHTGSPERRLLLAVLERAILDFVGNDSRELEEANDWIFGDDGALHSGAAPQFSFRWICQELDLDPAKIMETIRAMPKRGSRRIAPWYFDRQAEVQSA